MRQQVDELQRDIAQLRRNNADTPSVATRGNATPILPAPDLAQLRGRIEQQEKDLGDTRNRLNSSLIKCNDLEALCKAQDDELNELRNRVRDLTNTDQVRCAAAIYTVTETRQACCCADCSSAKAYKMHKDIDSEIRGRCW